MKTLDWPKIDLNSLYGHLELGQLLKTSESDDKIYYAHMDKNNFDLDQDHELFDTLVTEAGKIDLSLKKSDSEKLPPSSIHSVLKRKNTIPGTYRVSCPIWIWVILKSNCYFDFDVWHFSPSIFMTDKCVHFDLWNKMGQIIGEPFEKLKKNSRFQNVHIFPSKS